MKRSMKVITLGLTCFVFSAMVMFSQSAVYASPQAKNDGNVGYRLLVDGASWGIIEDKATLNQLLDDYKADTLKSISGEVVVESSTFDQVIEVVEVSADPSTFTTIETITNKVMAEETSEINYIVKKGDSLWTIAEVNKIPLATLLKLNPAINPKRIVAGQSIILTPKDPVIDVIADLQTSSVKPVAFTTEYVKDSSLTKGKTIVARKGVAGSFKTTYAIHLVNGYVESKVIFKEEQVVAPINTIIKVGTKVIIPKKPIVKKPVVKAPVVKTPVVKAPVVKPPVIKSTPRDFGVVYGRISSDYGYRIDPFTGKRAFHTGIDISCSNGSPVYAYAGGKVVESTSNSVRGNYITIDHGNGLKTSYLHLSTRLVKVGEIVTAKLLIGNVGKTGSATGYHLHFTVIVDGKLVSPWDYV